MSLCLDMATLLVGAYHGWRKKGIRHRVGGPTYAAWSLPQYISAFATRVLQSTFECVRGERAWVWIFKLLRTPGINSTELIPSNLLPLPIAMVVVPAHQATYARRIDSIESESILALIKSLKILALENYDCLLHHTFTDSQWSKLNWFLFQTLTAV